MIKKASYVIPYHLNNALFNIDDEIVNRDNCAYSHFLLKKTFSSRCYDLSTYDVNPINDSDAVIYHDMPLKLPAKVDINKSYLIIFESELIKPDNWDIEKHEYFNKIFTWNDQFVDNKKYFKVNFSHLFPNEINKGLNKNKNFCTLIAGNKKVIHPLELYSKRVEAIRWFEKYHPDDFEFYGMGWQEVAVQNKYANYLLKKLKLSTLFKVRYPSYQGSVVSKKETLERYKFAICYENARDIPGYITEKIFDCFFAGCIPVYWGANNITQHIPKECFIDRRDFSGMDSLYDCMKAMTDEEIAGYQQHADEFLKSDAAHPFSAQYFAETIVNTVIKEIDD